MNRDTICVQGGYTPGNGEPRQIPIIQSTTFKYATSEDMGKLFDLEADGYFYSRLQNPTCDMVAKKICELEGGTAAMLTSSGQAANFFALFNICEAGDHIVASSTIYGGTFNLLGTTLAKLGITTTFISPDSSDIEIESAIRPETRLIFGESVANPALTGLDIERFAKVAHKNHLPLFVDNTFPSPVNCRPIEWGADVVLHSTSKYLDGHAMSLGGCVVDSGNFDWTKSPRHTDMCAPDESYHGLVYTEKFGKAAFIAKARAQMMRDIGMAMSPMNAFLLNVGIETLHLRMPVHCSNALAVAEFLLSNPKVAWVEYPGLKNNRYHALAGKYMPNGTCGVISFGIKGGRGAAEKFMESVRLAAPVIHVADVRTCVLHPASTTHRQLSDKQLEECGVTPDLIRMSVGIEYVGDIIADLEAALEKC